MLVQTVNCIFMQAKDSGEIVVMRLKHARGWVSEAEADGKVLMQAMSPLENGQHFKVYNLCIEKGESMRPSARN